MSTEKTLAARLAAHTSWSNTTDRSARTTPARAALEQRFLDEADGDPQRAESLRRAHYTRMALRSAQVRKARKALSTAIDAEQELIEDSCADGSVA